MSDPMARPQTTLPTATTTTPRTENSNARCSVRLPSLPRGAAWRTRLAGLVVRLAGAVKMDSIAVGGSGRQL